ncbi:TPA: protein Ead [Klebsiella pneumoniae]
MTDITELTAEKLEEIRQRYRPTLAPKCHICGVEMTIQRMSASRITYGCAGAIYDETGCHYAEGRSLADDHYAESRITVVDVSDPDVLAMVEALEKAQRANAAQDDHINQQQDRINKLEEGCKHAAKRINSWRRLAKQSIAEQEKCVDELDAARQRIVELDRKNCELDSLTQRWAVERAENAERIAELESQLKSAENNEIDARCHITELESRTVKLPDFRHEDFNSDWGEHDAEAYQVALREVLAAAGIKVEAE